MKLLAAIALLQSAVLLYLVVMTVDFDSTLDELRVEIEAERAQSQRGSSGVPAVSTLPSLDEHQMRAIIRDELAALFDLPDSSVSSHEVPAPPSSIEDVEAVRVQLDRIVSSGQIDQRELDRIQIQMVQLDATSRQVMFRELAEAINSGKVRITIH